jgi:hypothetical protein
MEVKKEEAPAPKTQEIDKNQKHRQETLLRFAAVELEGVIKKD